jgi:hypothetical protein
MLTLIAFPLLILLAAVLLGFLFALLSKRAHPNDRLSASGPTVTLHAEPTPPNPLRNAIDGDEEKLQRLVEYERRLNPLSPEIDLQLRAYERLRRHRGNN